MQRTLASLQASQVALSFFSFLLLEFESLAAGDDGMKFIMTATPSCTLDNGQFLDRSHEDN